MVLPLLRRIRGPGSGEEYRLQVASLYRERFTHYLDGPMGTGSGELVMDRLGREPGQGKVPTAPSCTTDPSVRLGGLAGSFGR